MGFMACNDRVPKIWPFDKFHPSVMPPFVKENLWALDVASKYRGLKVAKIRFLPPSPEPPGGQIGKILGYFK